jgi:hypothetical protein
LLSVSEETVFGNGIEIISKRAKLQFDIFKILVGHYKEHYFESETLFLSTKQIIQSLIKIKDIEIFPIQVIQAIEKIRLSTYEKLNNPIIVSEKWKGYGISSNVVIKKGGI